MDITKLFKIILGCKLLVLLGQVSQVFGSCRILEIRTIIKDKVLTNHTIRTVQPIIDARTCRAQCFLESLCFGVNFCVDQNSKAKCELTSSEHIRSEGDLVDKPGCTFYGSESGCSSNPCASNATCVGDFIDTPPHRCICPKGYAGQMCELDIDECTSGVHECSDHANCTNFHGGHGCTCKSGFHGDGKVCIDIDECAVGNHGCHVNATCSNTMGGHQCTCKDGHQGNGYKCEDIDECTSGVHECSEHANCTNFHGGHDCTCKSGFNGDGKVCVDIDECALGNHGCHVNAMCSNTMGGHQCVCKDGYQGNGYKCEEIPVQAELVCEGGTLTMSCPNGQLLRMKWALYGRSSKDVCLHSSMKVPCGNEASSLIKVKEECEGKQSCSFTAGYSFFGNDPCGGFYKYTEVKYACQAL